jgi:D-glycero-D-manno-heptose 1,7-bisphosphate phosphatase
VSRPAVFLDRDGVLIAEVDLLVNVTDIDVLSGAPEALTALSEAGYALVVVTNQTVVARGLLTEEELERLHVALRERLRERGAPELDGIYVCMHHPNATLSAYRSDCECRKPRPGMLLRAGRELDLDLRSSVLIGDRPSDIVAGALAGCATVLVQTGAHEAPAIETTLECNEKIEPDHVCADIGEAARWILDRR